MRLKKMGQIEPVMDALTTTYSLSPLLFLYTEEYIHMQSKILRAYGCQGLINYNALFVPIFFTILCLFFNCITSTITHPTNCQQANHLPITLVRRSPAVATRERPGSIITWGAIAIIWNQNQQKGLQCLIDIDKTQFQKSATCNSGSPGREAARSTGLFLNIC